jgi:OmpA-OmpF porin, OOP family
MKSNTKVALASLIAAGIVLVAPISGFAQAMQDRGWYVGGSLGQSKVHIDTGSLASDLASVGINTTGFSTDEKDTGWKIFGGYKFNRNFAVEAAYMDLGDFNARTTATLPPLVPTPTPLTLTFKVKELFNIAAVGILPITNQVSVFGKLGGYRAKTELRASAVSTASNSDTNTDFFFGLGVGYDFTRNLGIRAEWEKFKKVGDKDETFQGDVDFYSLGFIYRFQ